ncbi:rRNA-processing protein and EBNA1-binding protein ebp2 [Rhizoclosmatium sp. JEL0117]|nr:rRNA-processing protein and EBNA1-binding protein ebp2 [Rhizoclosmatium sp. JEL0117]
MFKGKASTVVSGGIRKPKARTSAPKGKTSAAEKREALDLDIDAFVAQAGGGGGGVDALLSGGSLRQVSKKKLKQKEKEKEKEHEEHEHDQLDDMDAEELAELKAYEEIQKEQRKAERELKAIERLLTGGAEGDDDDEDEDDDEDDDDADNNKPKVFKNDKIALRAKLDHIRLDNTPGAVLPWIEFQRVTASKPLDLLPAEVDNDLKREMAFYKQALEAALVGYKELRKLNVPVHRPDDYYAEMIKSDEHMNMVRQKLVDEANAIAASEKAKKLRDAKKFGKKVQQEKLLERQKSKREELDKVKLLRKKANSTKNNEDGGDDEFGIAVDKEYGGTGKSETKAATKAKVNHKRLSKDKKFGFGGKKRHSKSNDRESTSDMSSFNGRKMKRDALKGAKKGGVGKQQRPGKARRQQQKGRK